MTWEVDDKSGSVLREHWPDDTLVLKLDQSKSVNLSQSPFSDSASL